MSYSKTLSVEYRATIDFDIPAGIDLESKDVRWEIRDGENMDYKYLFVEKRNNGVIEESRIVESKIYWNFAENPEPNSVKLEYFRAGKKLYSDVDEDALGFPNETSKSFENRDKLYKRLYQKYLLNDSNERTKEMNVCIEDFPYWEEYKKMFESEAAAAEAKAAETEYLNAVEFEHEMLQGK